VLPSMARGIFFLSLFALAFTNLSAQDEDEFDSLLIREIVVENPVYKPVIGISAGVLNFNGDVSNAFPTPLIGNYALQLKVSSFIDRKRNFIANFSLLTGALTGNERSTDNLVRNLNFRANIITFGISLEYNFGHLIKKNTPAFMPFVSVGFENISFNSKGDLLDRNGLEYYYWSDGTIRNISEEDKNLVPNTLLHRDWDFETDLREQDRWGLGNYSQNAFAIPIDLGLDFYLTERIKLRFGYSHHFTTTDLIDNVSWQADGVTGDEKNDAYGFSYFTLHLDLFSEPKVITEELMFAELDDFDYTMFEDIDGDGVYDGSDICPKTPVNVMVDTSGCPLDGDNDGVPDYLDQEPGSEPGAFVNDQGITLTEEQLIALLSPGDAVPREDLELYFMEQQEGQRISLESMPEKFKALDLDGDSYLSFDELLKSIDDFFDFSSKLETEEVYLVINFFFLQ
jgi:hypothetical protein